jgi:hypothetical protein
MQTFPTFPTSLGGIRTILVKHSNLEPPRHKGTKLHQDLRVTFESLSLCGSSFGTSLNL